MSPTKVLELRIVTGSKGYKYTYQAIENGNVIASRNSNQEYVSAFVMEKWFNRKSRIVENYAMPFCFSRIDLIGKGASHGFEPYAVAVINQLKTDVVNWVEIKGDKGTTTIIGIDPKDFHL